MICLFCSTEKYDLISAIIRARTQCAWSHCGFYDTETKLTYSAMFDGKGMAWRPVKRTQKMLLLTAPGVDEAFKWALTQIGKPYDWKAILGIAIGKNMHADGHLFCAYVCFGSFIATANPLLAHWALPLEHLTPRDMLVSPKVSLLSI